MKKEILSGAVVLIMDIRRVPGEDELGLIAWLAERGRPCIPVLTKADAFRKRAHKAGEGSSRSSEYAC